MFSDDRFRGFSLSDGRPVGILDLSYDAPEGFYGALSGSIVATRDEGLQPLGLQLNAGYARQISPRLTLDVGAIHSTYARYSGDYSSKSYTEFYAGLASKRVSSRIYVSPDYLEQGVWTVYGEVEASAPLGPKWRLTGHAGLLVPLRDRKGYESYDAQVDWRLGLLREVGPISLQAAWTGVSRRRSQERYPARGGNALIVGISWVP